VTSEELREAIRDLATNSADLMTDAKRLLADGQIDRVEQELSGAELMLLGYIEVAAGALREADGLADQMFASVPDEPPWDDED
jgi:hypothetical protein